MFAADALPTGFFLENAWLIPLVPAIGFAIIIGSARSCRKGSEIGIASMAISTVLAVGAVVQWMQRVNAADSAGGGDGGAMESVNGFARSVFPSATAGENGEPYVDPVIRTWTWWQNGGLEFGLGQHIDGLAVLMLSLVAFISLLVQIFSLDYVRGDRRYTHFFAAITLFSAGMLVMVLAENMVQIILGWEIMGLCSFMLIGHWWEEDGQQQGGAQGVLHRARRRRRPARRHGDHLLRRQPVGHRQPRLARLQRAGHLGVGAVGRCRHPGAAVGFGGAVHRLHRQVGSVPAAHLAARRHGRPHPRQSSLLHSSTMVVAGVFLVARLYPVFWEGLAIGPGGLNVIAIIGASPS
jgi:NADH-quinone oxidoreductase subunit L